MFRINTVIDYIDENIKCDLKTKDISELVNYSDSHIQRKFKEFTGISVMEYIKTKKLIFSTKLLIKTNIRICEIALEAGFQYEQSYIRAFKKAYGITPKQYRIKFKNYD
ncbi:helix-turn-helix domain-containing protein [Clostridium hydrogeniformans]|uniref:helix-turn-helix domain-containing protein n=1 Tax=Clostridium hydrogeniformans TaxID=349933 RepID=UPI000487B524|nr:AraC family transcriptional regulator [Clostridium hydrogeniformans]